MNPIRLRDPDQFLFHVVPRIAERGTDPLDLGQLIALQGEPMRREGVLRILDQTPAELRVLHRAAHDRANHFIAH